MKLLPIILLILAVSLNLYWLYPETQVKSDVNDNAFAYALTFRTNEVWDQYCHFTLNPLVLYSCILNLTDHWVDYWAQGYPLPHFYQHLPSIIFVAIYKLANIILPVSLYPVFKWVQFLTLSLFPLSLYWCSRKFGLNEQTSALTGILSTLISTQYLYGTDLNALTWRGSGMTTQLLGIVTLPLAIGSIYDTLLNSRSFIRSILLLTLTFHMHLLFGFIASLSTLMLGIMNFAANMASPKTIFLRHVAQPATRHTTTNPLARWLASIEIMPGDKRMESHKSGQLSVPEKSMVERSPVVDTLKIFIPTALLLSYWLLPLLLHNQLHNTSVWDEQIKFNSYGSKTVIQKLLSGNLLDANRLPILTFLLFTGILISLSKFFSSLQPSDSPILRHSDSPIAPTLRLSDSPNTIFLFLPSLLLFWLILYFGPATWGKLFYLIPGTEGLHVHRLINGVHFASFFLLGIALSDTFEFLKTKLALPLASLCILLLLLPTLKERHEYMTYNAQLIHEHNNLYDQQKEDLEKALKIIQANSARTNTGRPGNWGKQFTTGNSENFLLFSENGLSTIGWLPQSWSPLSDIEQFWDENRLDHYQFFNVGYIYSPSSQPLPEFSQEIFTGNRSHLAKVSNSGNFHFITSPLTVFSHKDNILNLQRLWLESDWPKSWSTPQIIFTDSPLKAKRPGKGPIDGPNIRMISLGTYILDDQIPHNLISSDIFKQAPSQLPKNAKVISEEKISPQLYRAIVQTDQTLALMLKVTYHPYWQVTIDGKPASKFMVAPAFIAFPIPPGQHSVTVQYTVPLYKNFLLMTSLATLTSLLIYSTCKTHSYRV